MTAEPIEPREAGEDVRDLDRADVLDGIIRARRAADREEARLLAFAVHWVDLHPVEGEFSAGFREARPLTEVRPRGQTRAQVRVADPAQFDLPSLGGVGTPDVSELAVTELAAALDLSYGAGLTLVSEAVELCFRLPRLWGLVQSGALQAWKARQVARQTTGLSIAAVDFVDRHLAVSGCRNRVPNIRAVVHEALMQCDPDEAAAVEQRALDARGVTLDHRDSTATTNVFARLDTLDALDLDASLSELATTMGRLGDDRDLDVRRASALGMLAHPQRVLDLLAGNSVEGERTGLDKLDHPSGPGLDTFDDSADQRPLGRGLDTLDAPNSHRSAGCRLDMLDRPGVGSGSRATLFLHIDAADLAENSGGGTVEKLGAATLDLLRDWLIRTDHLTVRPVLDMSRADAVDAHDPPAWMRELIVQRDPHCVFPGCTVDSRRCDLDHREPYVPLAEGGRPGQTSPTALAPLCRRHHRHKTFGGWRYRRLPDDPDPAGPATRYEWVSPSNRTFRVTTRPR